MPQPLAQAQALAQTLQPVDAMRQDATDDAEQLQQQQPQQPQQPQPPSPPLISNQNDHPANGDNSQALHRWPPQRNPPINQNLHYPHYNAPNHIIRAPQQPPPQRHDYPPINQDQYKPISHLQLQKRDYKVEVLVVSEANATVVPRGSRKLALLMTFHAKTQVDKTKSTLIDLWGANPPCKIDSDGDYQLILHVESEDAVEKAASVAHLLEVRNRLSCCL